MKNVGAIVNILEMFCCLAINTAPIKVLYKEIEGKGFLLACATNKQVCTQPSSRLHPNHILKLLCIKMRMWAMWEVFHECFPSDVNPFATSSVISTRKAPALRMGKLAESMVLRNYGF